MAWFWIWMPKRSTSQRPKAAAAAWRPQPETEASLLPGQGLAWRGRTRVSPSIWRSSFPCRTLALVRPARLAPVGSVFQRSLPSRSETASSMATRGERVLLCNFALAAVEQRRGSHSICRPATPWSGASTRSVGTGFWAGWHGHSSENPRTSSRRQMRGTTVPAGPKERRVEQFGVFGRQGRNDEACPRSPGWMAQAPARCPPLHLEPEWTNCAAAEAAIRWSGNRGLGYQERNAAVILWAKTQRPAGWWASASCH